MSQSDYIQMKKNKQELKVQGDLSPVLSSDDYISFKQYATEYTIINTKPRYNVLVPPTKKNVFNMEQLKESSCPTFIMDSRIGARANRIPMGNIYFRPLQPAKYVKHPKVICRNCCTPTTSPSLLKNNANTLFSLCLAKKLKNKMCNCADLQN